MCSLNNQNTGPTARPPLPFDADGGGYDYDSAKRAGLAAGDDGHWPSRAPLTADEAKALGLPRDSGVMLKGKSHPTWSKAVEADQAMGYRIVKKGRRYYSVKD